MELNIVEAALIRDLLQSRYFQMERDYYSGGDNGIDPEDLQDLLALIERVSNHVSSLADRT